VLEMLSLGVNISGNEQAIVLATMTNTTKTRYAGRLRKKTFVNEESTPDAIR
jgi:hypothetical protein